MPALWASDRLAPEEEADEMSRSFRSLIPLTLLFGLTQCTSEDAPTDRSDFELRHHIHLRNHPDLSTAPLVADLAQPQPAPDLSTPTLTYDLAVAPPPATPDMAVSASGVTVSRVDPTSGPPSSYVTVSGANFQSGDTVQLSSAAIGTLTLGTLSLTASAIVATLPSSVPAGATKLRVARGGAAVPSGGLDFTVASGKVYYAAPTGSDSAAGSIGSPWQRIDTAAGKMSPGDVLYLRGGTYGSAYSIHASGTAAAPLHFIGYPGEAAILVAPSTSAQWTTLSVQGNYLGFQHLHITDHHVPSNAVEIVVAAHDVTFSDCEIYGAAGQGVILVGSHNTFVHNDIHDNGYHDKLDHGVYVEGSYNTIRGNRIYNNWTYGIQFYNGTGSGGGNNVAEQNVIYHNGYGAKAAVAGFSDTAGVIMADVHPNNVVRNNVLCDNADYALLVVANQPGQQVSGNVSCYNHTGGFYLAQPGTGSTFTGNISYNDAQPALIAYPTVTSNNNDYWSTSGAIKLTWSGTSYTTLSSFQSASGQDSASRVANPQFTNVPSSGFQSSQIMSYSFCSATTPALCPGTAAYF
jgi:Right handed beta helix region